MNAVVSNAGRTLIAGFVALMLVLVLLPARQLVNHKVTMSRLSARLEALRSENSILDDRIADLTDPKAVERLARTSQGFVEPGEEAYLLVPPREEPVRLKQLPAPTRPSTIERLWFWLVGAD